MPSTGILTAATGTGGAPVAPSRRAGTRHGLICALALAAALPWAAQGHDAPDHQIVETTMQIRQHPKDAGLYLHRGRLHRDIEDFDAAQRDFRKALALGPHLPAAHYFLAETLLKNGETAAAEREATAFIHALKAEDAGGLRRGYRLLGQVLLAQSRNREAAETLRRAIRYSERPEPEQYAECARAYFGTAPDGVDQALAVLDDGIARLGPLASLQTTAIDISIRAARTDEALRRLDRQIALGQGTEFLLFRKGEVLRGIDRKSEARVAYQQALQAIGTRPLSRQNIPAIAKLRDDTQQRLAEPLSGSDW